MDRFQEIHFYCMRSHLTDIHVPGRTEETTQRLRPPTLIRDRPDRGEEQEILRGESDGHSSSTPRQDDTEAKNDFWSITGDFIYRHHVEPRVKLYMPREESFPIPLKSFDVTRNTYIT